MGDGEKQAEASVKPKRKRPAWTTFLIASALIFAAHYGVYRLLFAILNFAGDTRSPKWIDRVVPALRVLSFPLSFCAEGRWSLQSPMMALNSVLWAVAIVGAWRMLHRLVRRGRQE